MESPHRNRKHDQLALLVTRHSLAHELLALNLVSRSDLVDGGFCVREHIVRNRVFSIHVGHEPRFIAKQSTPEGTARLWQTISREAKCLEFAREHEFLRRHLPRLLHIDHAQQFMIQEYVRGQAFIDLRQRDLAERVQTARLLGSTLAAVHREMRPLFDNADDDENTTRPAWILSPHRIWNSKQLRQNPSLLGFAAVLKKFPEVETALDATSKLWERNAWIHHDAKLGNCLLAEDSKGAPRVVFVDWELARLGDTAWDVAGVLHSVIGDSIIRRDRKRDGNDTAASDDQSLADATTITSTVCEAYLDEAKVSSADRPEFRHRCLLYTGARLVQFASECQTKRRMTTHGLLLLQAGLNLMQNPTSFAEMAGLQPQT